MNVGCLPAGAKGGDQKSVDDVVVVVVSSCSAVGSEGLRMAGPGRARRINQTVLMCVCM